MAARSVGGAPVAQASGPPTRHPSARIVLIVEQGRLGFFVTRRRGIDAGHGGFHRVQHTRRISVQRGHSQGALTGRADELATQPFDKLLPGFDVHHFRPRAADCVSQRMADCAARVRGRQRPSRRADGSRHEAAGSGRRRQSPRRSSVGQCIPFRLSRGGSVPDSCVWFASRAVSAVCARSHAC